MFHHHHPDSVAERIDALMAAVFVADDRDRIEQLQANLAPGFVYISPSAVVDGPDGLSDAFSHSRNDRRLDATLSRTSAVDVHHGYFRYSWQREEGGKVAMEGWSFGWLDADGKVARIVSFEGLVPGSVRSPQS